MPITNEELKILKHNSKVDFSNKGFNDDDASKIAAAIKDNKSLQSLNLGNNPIGNIGAQALATALTFNRTLQELDIRMTSIGTPGLKFFAEMFNHNYTLITIYIHDALFEEFLKSNLAIKLCFAPLSLYSHFIFSFYILIFLLGLKSLNTQYSV